MLWPHSFVTFQDLSHTPSHQCQVRIRAFQDPQSSDSPYPSVASCISDWEQKFSVETSSQATHPGTPQYSSRGPAQGTSSVGRRRGQRWAPDNESPATSVVYGLNLEEYKRVSVSVLVFLQRVFVLCLI